MTWPEALFGTAVVVVLGLVALTWIAGRKRP